MPCWTRRASTCGCARCAMTMCSSGGFRGAEMRNYQDYKTAFQVISMPFAFVDLDLLKVNIRQIITRVGGKRIRIASKSIRSVALIEKILASNAVFQGVMC